ncbi:SGNH hydrolase domain-containing protein [Leucobacter sp. HY1908]
MRYRFVTGALACLLLAAAACAGVALKPAETRQEAIHEPPSQFAIEPLSALSPQAAQQQATKSDVRFALTDYPAIYDSACYATYAQSSIGKCVVVPSDGEFSVFLVGDSHAMQWSSPLREIAQDRQWKLTVIGKRGCPFSYNEQTNNVDDMYPACEAWNENLQARIKRDRPDLVITSNFAFNRVASHGRVLDNAAGGAGERALASGFVKAWAPVLSSGSRLVVIRDTPYFGFHVPDCIAQNLTRVSACDLNFQAVERRQPNPESIAVDRLDGVDLLDFTQEFCPGGLRCPAMIDDVIVWRDKHHLADAFARRLTGSLSDALSEYVG